MAENDDSNPILSVAQLVEYLNSVITRRRVTVEGEISSYKVSQGKWVFFDLKDETTMVSCFIALYQLGARLEDGMKVQVLGVPRIYGKTGRFSLYADSVTPVGDGALKRAFELTKAKLTAEGLFDSARKRLLPFAPRKIALIASSESAAYSDFMRIVNQRWGGLEIYLYHTAVQGDSAVKEIVAAFDCFNKNAAELGCEALVLIRGGGSLEDLQAFNSEPVARAVFGSKLPVVCGVGHEKDESLADYAADVRAATPTHAASMLVPDRDEMTQRVSLLARRLGVSLERTLEWQEHRVGSAVNALEHALSRHLFRCKLAIQGLLLAGVNLENGIRQWQDKADFLTSTLVTVMDRRVREQRQVFTYLEKSLHNFNPVGVLKRGYSIVKKKGRVITSRSQLMAGESIEITLSDGQLPATISSAQRTLV